MTGAAATPGRPLVVELLGAPGAGKSTIYRELMRRGEGMRPGPVLGRGSRAPLLGWHALRVLGMLARRGALGRQWTRERLLSLAYLRALPRVLARPGAVDGHTVVFDQGPLFFLSRPMLADPRLDGWRDRGFDIWSEILDVVIWLEAPDPVLLERINARGKAHRLKGSDDEAALKDLAEARSTYEWSVDRVSRGSDPPAIIRYDTSTRRPGEIVDELLAAVDAAAVGRCLSSTPVGGDASPAGWSPVS